MKYVLSEQEYNELKNKADNWDKQRWALKENIRKAVVELVEILRRHNTSDEVVTSKDLFGRKTLIRVYRFPPLAQRELQDVINFLYGVNEVDTDVWRRVP